MPGSRRHSSIAVHKDGIDEVENVLKPTPSHFEKLYLQPEQAVAGKLRLTFANPTPIAICGFLLANTPATIDLMGWHNAGEGTGNASSNVGAYYFLGAALLYVGAIGEWILGNTFPATVFFSFGGFWGAFGATLTPYFNVIKGYAEPSGFYDSFAFFLVFMAVLCLVYLIASIRTNVCLFLILLLFVVTFPCLAASYFYAAAGHVSASNSCRIAGGAAAFAASMIAWYLWLTMILDAVDFPIALPVGDLSGYVRGKSEKDVSMA